MATYESDDASPESAEARERIAHEKAEKFFRDKAEVTPPDARMDQGSTPEARASEHARELAEFQEWRRSKMDPAERKAEELVEKFARYDFDNTTADFWDQIARTILHGERAQETVQSFKKVVAVFEALRADLDMFSRKIKHAFEEDAEGEEE